MMYLVASFFAAGALAIDNVEWEHFKLLNALRKQGFSCTDGTSYPENDTPLEFDCRLYKAARLHSEDMAAQNYFSHTSKDGRSFSTRIANQGISGGARSENLAAGSSSANGALEQWKGSSGHCNNMMQSRFKYVGVGRAVNMNARYRYYWTQNFGSVVPNGADNSCLTDAQKQDNVVGGNGNNNTNEGGNTTNGGNNNGGDFDPTKCVINRGNEEKCSNCVTSNQCVDAYGAGWYCCPYMKKCVNSGSMSCFFPIANCNPRCFDQTHPIECPGCQNTNFPNNWITGCTADNNNQGPLPTAKPTLQTAKPTGQDSSDECSVLTTKSDCNAIPLCTYKKKKCIKVTAEWCEGFPTSKCSKKSKKKCELDTFKNLCVIEGTAPKPDCKDIPKKKQCKKDSRCKWSKVNGVNICSSN